MEKCGMLPRSWIEKNLNQLIQKNHIPKSEVLNLIRVLADEVSSSSEYDGILLDVDSWYYIVVSLLDFTIRNKAIDEKLNAQLFRNLRNITKCLIKRDEQINFQVGKIHIFITTKISTQDVRQTKIFLDDYLRPNPTIKALVKKIVEKREKKPLYP